MRSPNAKGVERGMVRIGIKVARISNIDNMIPAMANEMIPRSRGILPNPERSIRYSLILTTRVNTTAAIQVLIIQANRYRTQEAWLVSIPKRLIKESLYLKIQGIRSRKMRMIIELIVTIIVAVSIQSW
jgi:hypothetical protein